MAEAGEGGGDPSARAALALMVLIGSSTALAAKLAVRELPVGLLPIVRFGGAGLCLLPLVWRGGGLGRMLRQEPGRLLVASALCVPVNQTFFLNGTRLSDTSHVGLIYAACPLVVLLLAAALRQERLERRRLVGVLASVAGVGLIGLGNLWRRDAGAREALWGDLLLVGAVTSWGAYLTVNKPLLRRHGAFTVLTGTFLLGAALDLPVALATWGGGPSPRPVSATAWLALAYLTLVVSTLALGFQNLALRRLDASTVAVVGNVAPVLTVVWGVLFLGEPLAPTLLAGGALTLGGILWMGRPAVRPAPVPFAAAPRGAVAASPAGR